MDSWKSHLKFGIILMLSFIFMMHYWKGWYDITQFLPILILLIVSPIILDIDHKQGKIREGLTFTGLIIALTGSIAYGLGISLTSVIITGVVLASTSYLLFYMTRHRGFVQKLKKKLQSY